MSSIWQRIKDGLFLPPPDNANAGPKVDEPGNVPNLSQSASELERAPRRDGYPKTFFAGTLDGGDRPKIFDPALKHYSRAFRLGDPDFTDSETALKWHTCRDEVMHHILRIIMEPPREMHFVLRGSFLLTAWLGEEARRAGDLDFIFRPKTAAMNSLLAETMIAGLISAISERPRAGGAWIDVENTSIDDIWTYERAPGHRILFPWRAGNGPPGVVRIDVVFGEELWEEPNRVLIPNASGESTPSWCASPAASLAWKLLWLETDMHPQGKDLYDATLLAERTPLALALLKNVLQVGDYRIDRITADFPMRWNVDWPNFRLECPWVTGEATDWQERLTRALAPTFASA